MSSDGRTIFKICNQQAIQYKEITISNKYDKHHPLNGNADSGDVLYVVSLAQWCMFDFVLSLVSVWSRI